MAPTIPAVAFTPLFVLRVLSPSIVLLSTLSLLFTRPAAPSPQSSSPITSVIVATRTHRRALIYAFLSLAGLSYLLDGLTFAIWAVVRKEWPAFTGLEVNAVVGLVAFAGLAALGAWKEVRGVDVWSLKRHKYAIFAALALDIAQVVLLALAITREFPVSSRYMHVVSATEVRTTTNRAPDARCSCVSWSRLSVHPPPKPPLTSSLTDPLSTVFLLHLAFPSFRVLLLVPLFFALLFPRIAYVPVETPDEEAPTDTSLLLPAQDVAAPSAGLSPFSAEASKYGTFRSGRTLGQNSSPTTRTHTPAPSTVRVPPPKAQVSEVAHF